MNSLAMWMLQLLLGQLLCLERVKSLCHEYYVGLVPTMNGRIRDYALIDKSRVSSIESCTEACFLNSTCVTFFYNSNTGQCQTHSVLLKRNSADQMDANWRYYQFYTEKCSQKDGLILYRKENLCYFLSSEGKTWNDSNAECIKRGWRLMKITKKEVQDHLALALTDNNQYFIGLRSLDENNTWRQINGNPRNDEPLATNRWIWSEGEMLKSFISWAPNQNIITGATCVHLAAYQNRNWNNVQCPKALHFICEKIQQMWP